MPGNKKGLRNAHEYTIIGNVAIHEPNFFSRLITDSNGCHIWQGGKHKQNYGMTSTYNVAQNLRQMNVAHRVAMMLELGRELTRDEFVVHSLDCKSQLCCNPDHLILGDASKRNEIQYARGHKPNRGANKMPSKKQNRTYKYTDDEMRLMKYGTKEEIMKYFKCTKARACHYQWRMKKGYQWL
jgi:hypothetical protein